MGEANRHRPRMVFDWEKAARLINERNATVARAGLSGDWEWTGGVIFSNGMPNKNSGAYLASTWATPELEIDGERVACFRMIADTPGWDAGTTWPESALALLCHNAH